MEIPKSSQVALDIMGESLGADLIGLKHLTADELQGMLERAYSQGSDDGANNLLNDVKKLVAENITNMCKFRNQIEEGK